MTAATAAAKRRRHPPRLGVAACIAAAAFAPCSRAEDAQAIFARLASGRVLKYQHSGMRNTNEDTSPSRKTKRVRPMPEK